ncbi:MAG: RNA-binding cell elongation regulator Jag/EloR [Clostridia bacterium]|nr:RNA-binding cell elongation regulator Jag/EloR [Clostridia bacterium]
MKSIEKTGKTIDIAISEGLEELGISKDEAEIEVISEGSRGFLGIGGQEPKVRITVKETPYTLVKEYLDAVLSAMGLDAQVKGTYDDETVTADISGDAMGVVIGRRGDTLDALQYLCSLVCNKNSENYIRVSLDTEGYRQKREDTLISLAKRMAGLVFRSRKSMTLEPMNPNERRIIHSALQSYRNVTTYSTGEEPNRCVVIALKDRASTEPYVSKYRYNRKENELKTE